MLKNVAALIILNLLRPVRDLVRTVRGTHPVRIFTYHRVTDQCRDGMTVSPDIFDAQIRYLERHHEVVSLDRALELLRSGQKLRRPVAVITFDDAYSSVYTHAAPILHSHSAVATCFAATGLVSTKRRFDHDRGTPAEAFGTVMTWQQLGELRNEGWSVGSHTVNHARLSHCDAISLNHELADSKAALEEALGLRSIAIAYPFGSHTDITPAALEMIRQAGYAASMRNYGGENFPAAAEPPFELNRIDIGANHATLMWKLYAHGYDLRSLVPR